MHCSKCGKQLQEEDAFCSRCGTAIPGRENNRWNGSEPLEGTEQSEQTTKTKTRKRGWLIGLLAGVILLACGVLAMVIVAHMEEAEEERQNQVEEMFVYQMESIRSGTYEGVDCVSLFYNYCTRDLGETATGIIEKYIAAPEELRYLYDAKMKNFYYEINSMEKNEDGKYVIEATIGNTDTRQAFDTFLSGFTFDKAFHALTSEIAGEGATQSLIDDYSEAEKACAEEQLYSEHTYYFIYEVDKDGNCYLVDTDFELNVVFGF